MAEKEISGSQWAEQYQRPRWGRDIGTVLRSPRVGSLPSGSKSVTEGCDMGSDHNGLACSSVETGVPELLGQYSDNESSCYFTRVTWRLHWASICLSRAKWWSW